MIVRYWKLSASKCTLPRDGTGMPFCNTTRVAYGASQLPRVAWYVEHSLRHACHVTIGIELDPISALDQAKPHPADDAFWRGDIPNPDRPKIESSLRRQERMQQPRCSGIDRPLRV
jgi:hypothetical protein